MSTGVGSGMPTSSAVVLNRVDPVLRVEVVVKSIATRLPLLSIPARTSISDGGAV